MSKLQTESITFEFLGDTYRVTYHVHAGITELEKRRFTKWLDKEKWDVIYMGHNEVLEKAVSFFEHKDFERKQREVVNESITNNRKENDSVQT